MLRKHMHCCIDRTEFRLLCTWSSVAVVLTEGLCHYDML